MMIKLPPGCTINHHARIIIDDLTDEIGEWFVTIGGKAWKEDTGYVNRKGKHIYYKRVQYGKGEPSAIINEQSVIINFDQEDADIAMMFLLKFETNIISHNMTKEHVQ